MNRSTEQALTSLVPALNGPLPRELVELATSLLAQSWSRASNLKGEEEIARAYACAHLACERLKQTLNLPKIEPRPPLPPRIYQKLYKHLDQVLAVRPRPARSKPSAHASAPNFLPAKVNTSSTVSSRPSATPQKRLATKVVGKATVPQWVMPTIRHMCKLFFGSAAVPHMYAGAESVITGSPPYLPNNPRAPLEPKRDKLPALIVSLGFLVQTRLAGKVTPPSEYIRIRAPAVAELNGPELADKVDERVEETDVDCWMREISDRGWLRADWYKSIEKPRSDGVSTLGSADSADEASGSDGDQVRARRSRLSMSSSSAMEKVWYGPGSMMQPRVDYLSEEKRLDYLRWKEEMIIKIEQLEREQNQRREMDAVSEND